MKFLFTRLLERDDDLRWEAEIPPGKRVQPGLGGRAPYISRIKDIEKQAELWRLPIFCGLDRNYIGGIEPGERNLALINIEKIAQTFKISLSELLRGV